MSDTPHLAIEGVAKRYRGTPALADIALAIRRGEFLALLGPSGCGKSTLLRILAGLLAADEGRVTLDGADVTAMPPWRRDIGLVFQNYALFPHMTVRGNVRFGLEMRKIDRATADRMVDEALDTVRLGGLAERRPAELSGGQQQRVAIARAIAIKPRLLLLDEPLSNLDAVLRTSVRVELRELHERTGLTTIMVTHDQAEALTLADRVAVMSAGRVLQHGTPRDVYETPATAFVATFVGSPPASLLRITVAADGGLRLGEQPWTAPAGFVAACGGAKRRQVDLALRPERLRLGAPDAPGALPAEIRAVEYLGSDRIVHVEAAGQRLLVRVDGAVDLGGGSVGVLLPEGPPLLFDAETGARLPA
ncbi:ABC transporter ATP-binding protein [Prosthecomicrobium pneumaticum]|uniref:ABC-type sugar transport system ATPase subunit n=1 Tax=Prosthecomicrobium pneumaticum TaxID=81895 RepID=A0A7W9FJU1_9HYPH|nr:ABC transporter ATP-binding protein [Prosthecomicrobium pneumaticum]MBB5751855.1 ABC-type sugar transport system ATPase subunit [Prosthecomicrobium pneumaticum]